MNTAHKRVLLSVMKRLHEAGPQRESMRGFGICANVTGEFWDVMGRNDEPVEAPFPGYILETHFATWPENSGIKGYPVPSATYHGCASAESSYDATDDKWVGEYGAKRMELLSHCITELEKELAETTEPYTMGSITIK